MRRQRGFTLIELLVVLAALGGVVAAASGVVLSIRSTERFSREYAGDLAGLRRAVRIVEADLRAAADPEEIDVRLEGDRLVRDGRVLARNVAAFEVSRDGPLAHVRLALGSRCEAPRKRGELAFTVRLRNAEGER
jgi:type II secretion system protein J